MNRQVLSALLTAIMLHAPATVFARATPEQVAQLGGEKYTPVGAERAGNAAGTIPAWQPGLETKTTSRPGTASPAWAPTVTMTTVTSRLPKPLVEPLFSNRT